ncbi:MAG: hypothetical protein ACRYGC_04605 [Janthinobacterium lividum]
MGVCGRVMACLAVLLTGVATAGVAQADEAVTDRSPAAYCAKAGTDDSSHQLPHDMVDTAEQAFGLKLPAEQGERAVIWRCDGGKVLGCFFGANVPCGQMDRSTELPQVSDWCQDHPGAGVPQAVMGRDTLWRWSCDGSKAVRGNAAWTLDHRGFVQGLWRPLGPPTATP